MDEKLYSVFIEKVYPITLNLFSYLLYSNHSEIYNYIDACYDLTQEFFNYFSIEKLKTFKKGRIFYPWYKTIVYHFFFQNHRKKNKYMTVIIDDLDENYILHELIIDKEINNLLIKHLKKREYDIFILKFLYGLSNYEISRIVNCSISTIKRIIHNVLNNVIHIKKNKS